MSKQDSDEEEEWVTASGSSESDSKDLAEIPLCEMYNEKSPLLHSNSNSRDYSEIHVQESTSPDSYVSYTQNHSAFGHSATPPSAPWNDSIAATRHIRSYSPRSSTSEDLGNLPPKKKWFKRILQFSKEIILIVIWLLFTIVLMLKSENEPDLHQFSIPAAKDIHYPMVEVYSDTILRVTIRGAFLPEQYANLSSHHLYIQVVQKNSRDQSKNVSELWEIPVVDESFIGRTSEATMTKLIRVEKANYTFHWHPAVLTLWTDLTTNLPVAIGHVTVPLDIEQGVIYAACILVGLYVLIISEVVHRTLAAILMATVAVAVLAVLSQRPTMAELISWIDVETVILLFSMMTIMSIVSETGVFHYIAVTAYIATGGRVWPMITLLCITTAIISAFLDNVTIVLLMTPVTIKLCEVLHLDPVKILIAMVVFSNIGGTATAVGDPPNVIIASNKDVIKAGVDFGTFITHMGIGVIIIMIVAYVQLRFMYRDINSLRYDEPEDIVELRHEIAVWQRAASSLSSYSRDENAVRRHLMGKVAQLQNELKSKIGSTSIDRDIYNANVAELQERYPIQNKVLLIKSGVVLLFVVIMFFLHSVPSLHLSLGWTSLLGAILLLTISGHKDLDNVFSAVEWTTLIFFAALFVVMEALSRLGLIDFIGELTEKIILMVSEEYQLMVSILLILWVSAFSSAFVDNIPLTTIMLRIVINISNDLELPLQPLIWSLSFGACLGGNGTLIGASANVVCAGVAEQHGFHFSFREYFKIGFPMMLVSVVVASIYLVVIHVFLGWNY